MKSVYAIIFKGLSHKIIDDTRETVITKIKGGARILESYVIISFDDYSVFGEIRKCTRRY